MVRVTALARARLLVSLRHIADYRLLQAAIRRMLDFAVRFTRVRLRDGPQRYPFGVRRLESTNLVDCARFVE